MRKTLIVVPVKDPAASKTRLAGVLGASARRRLVRHLYRRTLDVLGPVAEAAEADLAVVTSSVEARRCAEERGVRVLDETGCVGLNHALSRTAEIAAADGYKRLCIIPADLAAPAPEEISRLLESDADVTVCPSTDQGTNALLLSPPDAIQFRYGARSSVRHLEEARLLGLSTRLMQLESLSFDIDTSTCLSLAIEAEPELARVCA
ncbi:MAG: 2-phospho-L-lactate guanylyltransferase [Pseudomonadota bacterium]